MPSNLILRAANQDDLGFLIEIDLLDEGCTTPEVYTPEELIKHRAKISAFITNADHGAWILEDVGVGCTAGVIMCRFRDPMCEVANDEDRFVLAAMTGDWPSSDKGYCSMFQLWVAPAYRRQGLATQLKKHIETEAKQRGIYAMYTHTEEKNAHVIALNLKLGYREIRRGPIWDEVVRVSLVKRLEVL